LGEEAMMSIGRRHLTAELIILGMIGSLLVGGAAFVCVSAFKARHAASGVAVAPVFETVAPALPPLLSAHYEDDNTIAPPPLPDMTPRVLNGPSPFAYRAETDEPAAPRVTAPVAAPREKQVFPSVPLTTQIVPMPARRPIEFNVALAAPSKPSDAPEPPQRSGAAPTEMQKRLDVTPPGVSQLPSQYDKFTAVYDLSAHTVYLPNGSSLEAHSGLGELLDDPSHVEEKDRGSTPPHLYDLTLREDLFHGVQALRLNPVGGSDAIFGRAGLLAHTYMLGPRGDSNGCVSFKNYDAFLQAFQSGLVKHLQVVARLH
jgi:Protein of unknown function (DUF2778)